MVPWATWLTISACRNEASNLASRSKRAAAVGRNSDITLTATRPPVERSMDSKTSAIPPEPASRESS